MCLSPRASGTPIRGSVCWRARRSHQYLAKPSPFARTFAKTEHEGWPSSVSTIAPVESRPRSGKYCSAIRGSSAPKRLLDEGKYVRHRAKTFDVYIATI